MLLFFGFIVAWSHNALAHSPHDDSFDIKPSPNFAVDQSVYGIVRSNFMLSRDGGESWRRVVSGLDHKYILYTFDIAGDGKTLYLASLGDGIYRSDDAGNRWKQANNGLANKVIDVVAIAPQRADHVIAAGATGGLFRSVNGGDSWQEVSGEFGKVTAIAFQPEISAQVFLGDEHGALYESEDSGATWAPIYRPHKEEAITSLAVSSTSSGNAFIVFGTADGKIGRSDNTSRQFSIDWQFPSHEAVVSVVVASESANGRVLYATLWDAGIYTSTDDGLNWTNCSEGLTHDRQSGQLGRPSFSKLAVAKPSDEGQTLFLAGYDGMFRSRDAGRSWQQMETLSTANIVGLAVSPTHASDSTLYLTNWLWGAHVSRNGGESWQSVNDGAVDYLRRNGVTRLFNIIFSPDFANDMTLFTSTWYRFLKSTDGGNSWRQISMVNDDEWTSKHHGLVIAVSADFRDDGTVYVGTHRGVVLKSTDRGETFHKLKDVNNVIGGLVIAPGREQTKLVFVGDSHGVHRSTDGGVSWDFTQLVDNELHFDIVASPVFSAEVAQNWVADQYSQREKEFGIRLSVSPAYVTDQTIFAGTPSGLFKTSDGGESWNRLQISGLSEDSYIESVAVSPDFADERILLVSVRGEGHFRSVDGGETFSSIGDNLVDDQIVLGQFVGMVPKFSGIVFSPSFTIDKAIYGYSGHALLRSVDIGETWEHLRAPEPSWLDIQYVKAKYRYSQIIPGKWYKSKKVWVAIVCAFGVPGYIVFAISKRRRRKKAVPA